MKILYNALTFDDVLLEPQFSDVAHRADVSTKTKLGRFSLDIPIVSANMDTITEYKMAKTMRELGGLGILHRFALPISVVDWVIKLKEEGLEPCPSIGIDNQALETAVAYILAGAKGVCIDVANGDNPKVHDLIWEIKERFPETTVIAGNIATYQAMVRMARTRVDVVKVGIGPGSLCTTRLVTGHGVPQLTAIDQCVKARNDHAKHIDIIADGGIRYSGDIVKALAVGADAVMVGQLLAGTTEAPGETFMDNKGQDLKRYRGMASRDAQLGWKGSVSGTPEGESVWVNHRGPVTPIIQELVAGVRSGMSYSGARTIDELQEYAMFVRVTSNAVKENGVHFKGK